MNDRSDLEFLVTDWLRASAPSGAPDRVLTTALNRIAGVGQERPLGGRRFDEWIGRSPRLHWALVAAALVAAVVGAILGAGALLREVRPVERSGGSSGWVAYMVAGNTRQGKSDIYIAKPGLGERRIIGSSTSEIRNACPAFSPDGTRLAYSEAPPGVIGTGLDGVAVVIVTLDPAGLPVGPVVRLPAPSVADACPKWAPDGRSLAFVAERDTGAGVQPELWIGRLDGTATRVAAWAGIGGAGQFDWSPDGTAVAATAAATIWIVPIDGRPAHRLLQGPPGILFEDAKWSPDGTRIAVMAETFVNDAAGGGSITSTSIEVLRADGLGTPTDVGTGNNPVWSPDGERIAFLRETSQGSVPQSEIVSVAPDGGALRVVATDKRVIRAFTWSPDGLHLVYVADYDSTSGGLVSVSATGESGPIVLTQQPYSFEYSSVLSWQPVFP